VPLRIWPEIQEMLREGHDALKGVIVLVRLAVSCLCSDCGCDAVDPKASSGAYCFDRLLHSCDRSNNAPACELLGIEAEPMPQLHTPAVVAVSSWLLDVGGAGGKVKVEACVALLDDWREARFPTRGKVVAHWFVSGAIRGYFHSLRGA
jgi:hypothetical protein